MIKGSIQEEDTTVVNTYAPNLQALQNIKQTLRGIRGETDNSTVIVHHLRHWTDHQNRDSVRKPNPKWNIRPNGPNWYLQGFPSTCRRIQFLLSAHGTFFRIDHILDHKSSFSKFKKIEILSSIFSDHNTMRLDINYRKNAKNHKCMDIKQCVTK